jgi:hypothetical protein
VRYVGPLPCNFLCRALSSVVAVNQIFAVRSCLCLPWPKSLPCVFLRAHGKEIFAVRKHTAKMQCTATAFFPVVKCTLLFNNTSLRTNEICSKDMQTLGSKTILGNPMISPILVNMNNTKSRKKLNYNAAIHVDR